MSMSKYYITTAIPYVNGAPHIGHAMDYCIADVCARYHKLIGDDVRLQAGTDEHGNKNSLKARELKVPTAEYVAKNAEKFKDFIHKLGVSYTDFIRTTDPEHEKRCQEIWQRLKNHIYLAKYNGWYCTGCERFVTKQECEENHGICPDHQKPYEKLEEENYYFRISDFKDKIRRVIEEDEMEILPKFRKLEVLKLLENSPDVSISRPTSQLTWGIPVPDDENQVMYVWIDALANYITVLGYPYKDILDWWPAKVQIVGKDILRFHAIIWPAMLLGLGLPLPKTLLSHGMVLSNGQKMSKTIGNVVDPMDVLKKHGTEAFRYFFLRHIDTFSDSDFTWQKFEDAYSNELANDLGNLVQRIAALAEKNQISYKDVALSHNSYERVADTFGLGTVSLAKRPRACPEDKGTDRTRTNYATKPKEALQLPSNYRELMDNFEFSKAFDVVWDKIQSLNRRIDEEKPWSLAKNGEKVKLESCLNSLIYELLEANLMLEPFLPETSKKIKAIFTGEIKTPASPLFPKEPN
ncbi:MAG: methionine--tRNA ligase [Candidatus Saccharibacteria bacterium]|nr:methionine--tRNA ligase [Candidatus Saccharibacteria bacterium]